ncbi:hypothetical protein Ddc_06574 [Ditylenchus destructor]|nr:hypothetical protein Ddc_06574 [Ditylenchus destructor]
MEEFAPSCGSIVHRNPLQGGIKFKVTGTGAVLPFGDTTPIAMFGDSADAPGNTTHQGVTLCEGQPHPVLSPNPDHRSEPDSQYWQWMCPLAEPVVAKRN